MFYFKRNCRLQNLQHCMLFDFFVRYTFCLATLYRSRNYDNVIIWMFWYSS